MKRSASLSCDIGKYLATSKYLNYITLREKFLYYDMEEVGFVEIDRLKGAEKCAIGVFRKIR